MPLIYSFCWTDLPACIYATSFFFSFFQYFHAGAAAFSYLLSSKGLSTQSVHISCCQYLLVQHLKEPEQRKFKAAWWSLASSATSVFSRLRANRKCSCTYAGIQQIVGCASINVIHVPSLKLHVHCLSCCDYKVADDLRLLLISAVIVSTCSSFE